MFVIIILLHHKSEIDTACYSLNDNIDPIWLDGSKAIHASRIMSKFGLVHTFEHTYRSVNYY